MTQQEKDQLSKVGEVEVEALSDEELEEAAGGLGKTLDDGSSNSCCTCSGDNCSLAEDPDA